MILNVIVWVGICDSCGGVTTFSSPDGILENSAAVYTIDCPNGCADGKVVMNRALTRQVERE